MDLTDFFNQISYLWNLLLINLKGFRNTILILLIPMLIGYTLLIIHALYTEGKKFTITFFGGFLIYGIIRELIVSNTAPTYQFSSFAPIFRIINIPIAIGWTFACYISFWFSKWIIIQLTEKNTSLIKSYISFMSAIFVWFITFAIEYTGSRMGWWNYNPAIPAGHIQIFGVYLFLLAGWGMTIFGFLLPFQLIYYADQIQISRKSQILSFTVIPAVYFGITFGNYLILYSSPLTYVILIIAWLPPISYLVVKWLRRRK